MSGLPRIYDSATRNQLIVGANYSCRSIDSVAADWELSAVAVLVRDSF